MLIGLCVLASLCLWHKSTLPNLDMCVTGHAPIRWTTAKLGQPIIPKEQEALSLSHTHTHIFMHIHSQCHKKKHVYTHIINLDILRVCVCVRWMWVCFFSWGRQLMVAVFKPKLNGWKDVTENKIGKTVRENERRCEVRNLDSWDLFLWLAVKSHTHTQSQLTNFNKNVISFFTVYIPLRHNCLFYAALCVHALSVCANNISL